MCVCVCVLQVPTGGLEWGSAGSAETSVHEVSLQQTPGHRGQRTTVGRPDRAHQGEGVEGGRVVEGQRTNGGSSGGGGSCLERTEFRLNMYMYICLYKCIKVY